MSQPFFDRIKEVLTKDLPGKAYQNQMASPFRFDYNADFDLRQEGSVLLLMYPSESTIQVVFIRKPFHNGIHGGQISLPGGRIESSDPSFTAAALRETEEEIGVAADAIKVLGSLTPIYVPASNFQVYPFVGYTEHKPNYHPSPHEVQQIIEVSLNKFVNQENRGIKILVRDDKPLKAPCFNVDNHQIWGATAMILSEFVEVVNRTDAITF